MEKYEFLILAIAILLPAFTAALCYIVTKTAVRNVIILFSVLMMFVAAGGFIVILSKAGGKIYLDLPFDVNLVIKLLDLLLLVYVLYIGLRLKKLIIVALTVLQLLPLVLFELFVPVHEPEAAFVIDNLSLVMILLVSVIGPIITVFALGYMKEHERHLHLKKTRQPRFFMIMFIFLSAMNALVMTNNMMWLYFFWEITTLCSFLLISHDRNPESVKNAVRALWINMLGGVAFISAILIIYKAKGTLSIEEIVNLQPAGDFTGLLPVGLGLLCFAGFTKSAQFPFQSWLLGAMVAPTPVSALLHSSTMVKAGVYLVVRLAPSFSGTLLGKMIAVVGGFTFMAASAIAISQSNGKRVLAYSTIANLGLIICCAGIGSYLALGAAVMLMIFHAVSKGLLFLCVGTVEQEIGSRDIEDMQGLMKRMPFTTVIMVIGMISMLLPPFGVLMTKWLAIEASIKLPVVLVLIILGSAFTVVFWAKWIGIILTMSYKPKYYLEKLPLSVKSSLAALIAGVLSASIGIVPMFNHFIKPYIESLKLAGDTAISGRGGGIWIFGGGTSPVGGFSIIPIFLIIFAVMFTIPYFLFKTRNEMIKPPYLCGENTDDVRGIEFTSPGDKVDNVIVHNYYLKGTFGENNLTLWTNIIAGAIILIMFGVVFK